MAMKNKASKLGVQHKYHGLLNQGATCYLNSVLQVLFMTEDFRESVKKSADTTYIDIELRDLFKDLEERVASTRKITNRLDIKNVSVPRDAAEHYEKILRLTSQGASEIFHGKLINRNKCKQCHTKYDSPAGFWSLPLPLVNNTEEYSVEKGIEDFFRPSEISGDDQMYCEECDDKRDAVLDCVVEHHPEVLVLLLKRFEFDYEYTYTYVKNQSCVNVPDTLQMPGSQTYKLYAMVEHFGELQYGHYISTIKSLYDDTWYEFNDSSVTRRSTLPALERSRSAYLLFYKKLKVPQPEIEEIALNDNQKRPRPDDESQEPVHVKKPKQELNGDELNFDEKVQKCEDLDTGSSSSNTIDSQFYPNHRERGERPNPPEPVHNSAGDITSGGTLVNTKNNNGFRTGERFTQTSELNSLGRETVGAYGFTNQQGEGQGSIQLDDKHKTVKTEEPLCETWQQQVECETQDLLGTEVIGADGSTKQLEEFRLEYAQGGGQGSIQSDEKTKIVKTEDSSETCQDQVNCEMQDFLPRESKCSAGADGSTNQPEKHRPECAQGEGQGSLQSDDKHKIAKTEEPLSETCQHQFTCETQEFLRREIECSAGADGSTNQPEESRPECAQGEGQGSLQSDDKSKIVKLCEGYESCEGSDLHTTEKQEQNIDLAVTTLPAMHLETEETIVRENENDNDTRVSSQYLGSGGNSLDQQKESSAEIVKFNVFNCAEEKNSKDASPMSASSPVCGYTEEDSVCKQGHESSSLRESSCKNADEKEGEGCTDEFSQDRDLKSHPKESFISAKGEKEEKAGSNCLDSAVAPCDCGTSVNQNDTEPASSALNRDLTRSVDLREKTEKTQNMGDAKSKAGVKALLTKYDLYLDSLKSNSKNYDSQSNVYDEEKLKKPECRRYEEGNKGDILSVTQTRGKEIQSWVVERRGNDEIIKITLKKSQ